MCVSWCGWQASAAALPEKSLLTLCLLTKRRRAAAAVLSDMWLQLLHLAITLQISKQQSCDCSCLAATAVAAIAATPAAAAAVAGIAAAAHRQAVQQCLP